MAFRVFTDPEQGAFFVVLLISTIICVVAIVLRFVSTNLAKREPSLEDWLALSAAVLFFVRIGVLLSSLIVINARYLELAYNPADYRSILKLIYIAEILTVPEQSLAKLSICSLYYRIFGINTAYRRWILFLAAFQTVACIVVTLVQAFQCRPTYGFWEFLSGADCWPQWVVLVATEPFNSVTDFALVILALVMLRSLQISSGIKWKLGFLFGLGSLAGIFGFLKIGLSVSPDSEHLIASLGLWAAIQSLAGIVCCCAPVYKPIMPQAGAWGRLVSKVSSRRLRLVSDQNSTSGQDSGHRDQSNEMFRQDATAVKWEVSSNTQAASHSSEAPYDLDTIKVQRQVDVV